MVAKKNLDKNEKYIYYYNVNVRPDVLRYMGMDTSRIKFIEDVAMFRTVSGKKFYPRLSDVYKVKSLKRDRKHLLIKLCFEVNIEH